MHQRIAMPQRWNICRTAYGKLAPLSCAAAGGMLLAVAGYLSQLPSAPGARHDLDAANITIVASVILIATAALEVQIRRHLAMARNGEPAEAIIDEVIDHRWQRHGGIFAEYHFFTPDGQWIDGRCHIDSTDALTVVTGGRIEVLYDPANPKRNQLLLRLWGVEYEDA
jgi:hypothetical protein